MRRPFMLLAAAATLLVAGSAAAQNHKIAYVDMMRAFTEVEEGRKGLKELERFKNERQGQLDEKQQILKKAKEDLDRQGMMIKPEVKQEKLEKLQRDMLETQQMFFNMQQELSKREVEFKMVISRKLQAVIQEIAERDGYTLVLDSTPGGPVVFGRAAGDITSEVIRGFNKRFGAGAKGGKGGKGKKKAQKKGG